MTRPICTKQWTLTALAALLIGLAVLSAAAQTVHAKTVKDLYPLLSDRFIKSATLTALEDDLILKTDTGIALTRSGMTQALEKQDPRLQDQLENNLIFLAEQEILTLILEDEVKKSGLADGKSVTQEQITAYLQSKVGDQTVSDKEAKTFYDENKEMVGGMPFDQVSDSIKKFLLENKQQTAVRTHIHDLGQRHQIRINEKWMDVQYKKMTDNPVDKARLSGKPTMVEFGADGCVPCDMMQPILDKLKKKFPDTLNIVFLHVRENQVLAGRYGIQSIPVQAFFDANGQEVFRHTGFFAEEAVTKQLKEMGVAQ
ncbi:thioredoxin domain-containing protein [Desulfotignum balticum]|uniref:thioredoxin domain-containing protein n=1 Tax=Desulfotignum balticum TaxID=115781 RepID=UPI0003F5440A|nr:thioredoxin domain-containing protein [Desulfotignum balticum]